MTTDNQPKPEGLVKKVRLRFWRKIRNQTSRASGTPYREVDISSLKPWNTFYESVIERLKDA